MKGRDCYLRRRSRWTQIASKQMPISPTSGKQSLARDGNPCSTAVPASKLPLRVVARALRKCGNFLWCDMGKGINWSCLWTGRGSRTRLWRTPRPMASIVCDVATDQKFAWAILRSRRRIASRSHPFLTSAGPCSVSTLLVQRHQWQL